MALGLPSRRYFGRSETASVAFWKRAVGILSEIELYIAAAASSVEEYLSCGTTRLPQAAFSRMVACHHQAVAA